jgi:hypothetical protein
MLVQSDKPKRNLHQYPPTGSVIIEIDYLENETQEPYGQRGFLFLHHFWCKAISQREPSQTPISLHELGQSSSIHVTKKRSEGRDSLSPLFGEFLCDVKFSAQFEHIKKCQRRHKYKARRVIAS